MKAKKMNKWVQFWWNIEGRDVRDLLSELSGDNDFVEKMPTTDLVNVYNFAKACEVTIEGDSESFLLKEICGELAEKALASKHGVSPDDLFDGNGNFYEQYQDEFNRFYDLLEDRITFHAFNNKLFRNKSLEETPTIYTTGAFLFPVRIKDEDGADVWMWAVSQFKDETFLDGVTCEPVEKADRCEDLLQTEDEDDDVQSSKKSSL